MASIKRLSGGKRYLLTSSYLVGRSDDCALRLASREVSIQHAAFRWTASGWELRDLNSRNGTFVDGRQLTGGEPALVRAGARIRFGEGDELFELVEDRPPGALAQTPEGEIIEAEDDLLFIPGAEQPEVIVSQESPGYWFAEIIDGDDRRVKNGDTFQCAGKVWRVTLPEVQDRTWQADQSQVLLDDIALRFTVTADQEYVTIAVVNRGELLAELPNLAFCELLLALARARVEDAELDIPEMERGWRYVDQIKKMLGEPDLHVDVLIHRARAKLRKLNIVGASDLVERRRSTRQLRLGVDRIELSS